MLFAWKCPPLLQVMSHLVGGMCTYIGAIVQTYWRQSFHFDFRMSHGVGGENRMEIVRYWQTPRQQKNAKLTRKTVKMPDFR